MSEKVDTQEKGMITAQQYLGHDTNIDVLANDNNTLFLYLYKDDPYVHFLVLNDHSDLILEKEVVRGSVNWLSNHTLQVIDYPGIVDNSNVKPKSSKRVIELHSEKR